jgi:diaminohydroxyphosphoribosylaminopyrimidine deaminase/5-amino-6-(5-phosphoribosylamino)uracil reductase
MVTARLNTHEQFMQRCLDLAARGLGQVAPNPMVGCVITVDDVVIGEGFHQKYGEAHAEVNAINSVADQSLLSKATLYVSLEPCSHHGKTPPCADLIIAKKIPHVVIGSNDPNPLVAGNGIKKLKDAGVEVITGVLKTEADFLNRRFITFHTEKRPYLILKWGQSSDGFMALNEPRQFWFTNSEAKKLMHKWRTEENGILVGRNTVAVDNCELTARLWQGTNPVRMVIDRHLALDNHFKIFNAEAQTLVFNEKENAVIGNVHRIKIDFAAPVIPQILSELYRRQIQSVTVEGGPATLHEFISTGNWDEARVFTSAHILKEGKAAPKLNSSPAEEITIADNVLKIYYRPQ